MIPLDICGHRFLLRMLGGCRDTTENVLFSSQGILGSFLSGICENVSQNFQNLVLLCHLMLLFLSAPMISS